MTGIEFDVPRVAPGWNLIVQVKNRLPYRLKRAYGKRCSYFEREIIRKGLHNHVKNGGTGLAGAPDSGAGGANSI